MNTSRRVLAGAAAAAVVLLGVGVAVWATGDEQDAAPSSSSSSSPEQPSREGKQLESKPGTWALTGRKVSGGGDGTQPHPAYVVKVDNTSSSVPQRGLHRADLVVEELVEGGTTRLAAFFHSELPSTVGPVRSMRATDIGVVSPARATVVTSGAAGPTIKRIEQAGITFIGEGNSGVYRDGARAVPYNLFADVRRIAGRARADHPDPGSYFDWGQSGDLPRGRSADGLSASFGSHTTTWRFAGGRYRSVGSYQADSERFDADTVVVMRVRVGDAGYRDPAGSVVPESKLTGGGPMSIFHGGREVRGRWTKETDDAPFMLSAGGEEVPVPAGNTWVELVPAGAGDVSVD